MMSQRKKAIWIDICGVCGVQLNIFQFPQKQNMWKLDNYVDFLCELIINMMSVV